MAQEAGVEDLYEIFYRFMSMATHGHEIGRDAKADAALTVEMQGVGALSIAIGHVGVRWLTRAELTDNETLRSLLGIGELG